MHTRQMYVVDSISFLVLSILCRLALLVIAPVPTFASSSPGSIQFIVFSTTFIMMPTPNLDLALSVRECKYSTSTFHRGVRGFLFPKLSAELTRSSRG